MKTELEGRTKECSIKVIRQVRTFPKAVDGIEVGRQLLRSAVSIGANYREANRAESKPDFIHKIGIAEKEASETVYWLEICLAAPLGVGDEIRLLLKESNELLVIITTIGRKTKGKIRRIPVLTNPAGALAIVMFSLSRFSLFAFHSPL
jgi:four helix bundle protein